MDTGIWRRLIVISFEVKIDGTSDVKNYAEHLYENAGGAILAWIMQGAALIHAEGYQLTPPRQVRQASAAYREENNWFAQFLDESCDTTDPVAQTRSGELYKSYRAWAAATGSYVRSTTDFYAALERAGYERRKTSGGMVVDRVALKSEFGERNQTF